MLPERPSYKQDWLLPYQNPLLRKFDKNFFKNIPSTPGVYVMRGLSDSILYIGKAKNLRNRLLSYRRAYPGQVSRKVIRMLNVVDQIVWEECETEEAALLLENHLLRTHRPPFNVLNTRPDTYYFIGVKAQEQRISFRLTMDPTPLNPTDPDQLYGAYKGRGLVRHGFCALLRLIWAANTEIDRFEFPMNLMGHRTPYEYHLNLNNIAKSGNLKTWNSLLRRFLNGTSNGFLKKLTERLLDNSKIPPFVYRCIQDDLELLEEFYEHGPHRNRRLRRHHGLSEPLIAQEQLDDLLVTYHQNQRAKTLKKKKAE